MAAFRKYKDIQIKTLVVPTVVEIPFGSEFLERYDFAVFDQTLSSFEPHFFKREVLDKEEILLANASSDAKGIQYLLDNNSSTYTEYSLSETGEGQAQIVLTSMNPVTSSRLTFLLARFVALPNTIKISVEEESKEKIVVAEQKIEKTTILFPKTTASKWIITFHYSQPLWIAELRLHQDDTPKISIQALRFLAQPDHNYRVYFDSDRNPEKRSIGEAGNLSSDTGVVVLPEATSQNNPEYIIADQDKDSVPDIQDNCVSVANVDQYDRDGNKRGDVCDDFDRDGLVNNGDNCPNIPNRDQQDTDGDGQGDVCDGEESRITEREPWLPWVAMGLGTLVIVGLFLATRRGGRDVKN